MNISDFILTIIVSGVVGIIAGFLLRDVVKFSYKQYCQRIRKPKYFQRVIFEKQPPQKNK
ncbi:hypothetical protein HC725_12640 [Vibrio sp. S17_S38]|uniref:hypothetical protein n=1 Tax=Vibrio sp. S17_S38 TaxID=2720229 RepID=UPI0016814FB9|nr:hypothetical protein [Vibrio sp. S17_S38]MBD1574111.1 hypothetical protein [Vibrio sp. S17_S38]